MIGVIICIALMIVMAGYGCASFKADCKELETYINEETGYIKEVKDEHDI